MGLPRPVIPAKAGIQGPLQDLKPLSHFMGEGQARSAATSQGEDARGDGAAAMRPEFSRPSAGHHSSSSSTSLSRSANPSM
jgi:hypothetical protein